MFFRKRKRLTTVYNALEQSQKRMKEFEEKYNIRSADIYNKEAGMIVTNDILEDSDRYLWETCIRVFLKCGGKLS